MGRYWEAFVQFLKEYSMTKAGEALRNVDWAQVLHQPVFWIAATLFLGWVVWKKAFKSLLVVCSAVGFILLLQHTLPPAGQPLTLEKLVPFAVGCLGILAVNVYFLIIRSG
ncbi:hypothetical protein SAMN02746041_01417 [Desulfacinum hydrothermale DSM 13146]|uniref:Uncharacterized protein n=1 Tax=Desulfacinum hydrothermale DSM 13146 TaxID=1121390 RepID=A0A1W1XEZ4_9BACT|nr:hypothetical protein [Desulfacinum hydrothermale]SMC22382.1 hypothetical protein SAMN02746041_01417 [Desulfacinum hydrothermale DSM 13146]